MTGNWFPRLSPSGRHLLAGDTAIAVWRDLKPPSEPPDLVIPGLGKGAWLDEGEIIANAHSGRDNGLYLAQLVGETHSVARVLFPDGTPVPGADSNTIRANGEGWWCAQSSAGLMVSDGKIYPDRSRGCMSTGPSLAHCRNRPGDVPPRELWVDETLIAGGDIDEVCWRDGLLTWRTLDGRVWLWGGVGRRDITVNAGVTGGEEFSPVGVVTPYGTYVLSHDNRGRLFLRIPGSHFGHLVATGTTDHPDARWVQERGKVRVVYGVTGPIREVWVDVTQPEVDLRIAPPDVLPPLPTDLWQWMTPSQDGLIVADAGGQTLQTWRTADGILDQIKWGQPWALERWSRHADEIRLDYDATDGRYPRAWRLVPNRWARRQFEPGVIDAYSDAVLIRRQEHGSSTSERFPFAVGQPAALGTLDLGGDLGVCAVRMLTFSPHYPGSGETETNWYAIRLSDGVRFGRVRFVLHRNGRLVTDTLFNRILPGPGVRPDAPLPIPDPPQEPPMKPPSAWGEFVYPREVRDRFTLLAVEPENGITFECDFREGQRAVIQWTVGGKVVTRTVADMTRFLGPGEVPPPPPPPGQWPREQVAKMRTGIALDQEFFSAFALSWENAKIIRFIDKLKALGLTHAIVMFSGEYRGRFPWFDLWDQPDTIKRKLDLFITRGIMPILWAANGESFAAGQRRIDATDAEKAITGVPLNVLLTGAGGFRARDGRLSRSTGMTVEYAWERTIPPVRDWLAAVVPAPEMNDIWTPEEQHSRTVLLRQLCPQHYLAVHLTRKRPHGDHNRGTGPAGNPPAAWNPRCCDDAGRQYVTLPDYYNATPCDAIWYNTGYEELENIPAFVDDLGDVSVRVNGRVPVPGKTAPYPGMGRDVIYGEGPAEWVLQGRWTWQDGQRLREAALSVPGITGWGD